MPRQLEMIVLRMLLDVILLSWLMTSVPRDVSSLFSCDTLIQHQTSVACLPAPREMHSCTTLGQ